MTLSDANAEAQADTRVVDISSGRPVEVGTESVPGSPLASDRKYCHACASILDTRAAICPKCGIAQVNLSADPATASGHSRISAALFALFLGGFGIHKFYLGKPVQGIFMLLFVWTFIPTIIAFIEGIIYLLMSDERFAAKYG